MRLSAEAAKQVADQYPAIYKRIEWLVIRILRELVPTLKNEKAREYLQHGVGRRTRTVTRCLANVFQIFPPERTELLSSDDLSDIQINLHAFVTNVYGVFDNLAWVYILEQGRASTIKGGRKAIGLFDGRTQEHLSKRLRGYLNDEQMKAWFSDYSKNYRDALAHRIPLYVPPLTATKEEGDRWKELDAKIWAAITAQQFEELERLQVEQRGLGKICAAFVHSYSDSEDSRPVLLHPQMLSDALTIATLLDLVIEDVQANGWGPWVNDEGEAKNQLPAALQASDRDAVAIMGVLWACRRDIPLKARTFLDEGLSWIKDHCQNGRCWVMKFPSPHQDDVEELGGFVLITPPKEEAGMQTEHHEVFWMAVDRQYRRRGIARALLRHAKTLHDVLVAKAQEGNGAVRALLEEERFQVSGPTQLGGWVLYDWLRDEDEPE